MLVAGVIASGVLNVLAADHLMGSTHSWGARGLALGAPVSFMATVEMLPRIPRAAGRELVWAARATAALVAFGAGWISYWHIVELAHGYGWDFWSSHLLPLTLDGMVGVSSLVLLAEARATEAATALAPAAPARAAAPAPPTVAERVTPAPPPAPVSDAPRPPQPAAPAPAKAAAAAGKVSRKPEVLKAKAEHPDWSNVAIAAHVGCDEGTVRRHLRTQAADGPESSGHRQGVTA